MVQKLTDAPTHIQTNRQAESNMPFQLFQSLGHKYPIKESDLLFLLKFE